MLLQIFLTVLLLVLLGYIASPRKPSRLPPGLWGWPIIGSMPSRDIAMADQVKEMRKKYGDIISHRFGSRLFVYLCNFKLIKTAFSKQETADRVDFYSIMSITQLRLGGIVNTNGLLWHNNRRFTLRHLKDLGMGKSHLGEAIENEAGHLVEDFKKYLNHSTSLPWSINIAVLNVIWQMAAGIRYDVDDEKMIRFGKAIYDATEAMGGPVIWLDIFPWLTSLLPFSVRSWLGMNDVIRLSGVVKTFIEEEIVKDHIKTLDRDNPRDFIDAYLLEMERQKDDPKSTMSLEDLCHGLVDLFAAGSLTTSQTIRWTILYLAKYPEVQRKAQKEIDTVVPRHVLPSLDQKDSLPYVEALSHEVTRLSSLVPMGVPHITNEDMELGGYKIPKNTVIVGHAECCHKDPSYWEKPNDFYPEHFLDENGTFSSKKEGFLPFSVGRRVCVGESLAKAEIFLFLAALLQNYTFSAPKGEQLSTEKNPTERLLNHPKPFNIIITERK